MAHIVETQMGTPGAELRGRLDRAERQLPALQPGELGEYLRSLNRVEELLETLTAEAADVRPEMTRWLDLQARLGSRAPKLVKLAGAEGGFAALRAANPPAEGAWWRLDQLVAEERKRSWTRWAVIGAVVVALLAVGAFVYSRWLAPSPEVVLVMSTLNQVEQLAQDQKWDEAATVVDQTLQTTPDDPDLLVWAAVLAERRGETDQAADYLARAKAAADDPLRFQLALSMKRLQAGDVDGAEAAASAAQAIKADEPQAVLLLGSVAELRSQVQEALALYQQAADLAEQQDNAQLTVIAKMRYGMLLQQLQYGGAAAPEASIEAPTEAPTEAPAVSPAP